MAIGNRIRERRMLLGLSLVELAKSCNFDKGYLSRIEQNKIIPQMANLLTLSLRLGVGIGYLLEDYQSNHPVMKKNKRGLVPDKSSRLLPLLNFRGSANDILKNHWIYDLVPISTRLFNDPTGKIMFVPDNSMIKYHLFQDDLVFISIDQPVKDRELAVVCLPKNVIVLREVRFPDTKQVLLLSGTTDKKHFPDIIVNRSDITHFFRVTHIFGNINHRK